MKFETKEDGKKVIKYIPSGVQHNPEPSTARGWRKRKAKDAKKGK